MSIKVKYFASLREEIGRATDDLQVSSSLTAKEVWKQATGRDNFSDNVLIALNQEYISENEQVRDGDEIAFFPPVTGG